MQWSDVPTLLDQYDSMEYADNSGGSLASQKLVRSFTGGSDDIADVPEKRRIEFMEQLEYRMGACANLSTSVAWKPRPGVWPQ